MARFFKLKINTMKLLKLTLVIALFFTLVPMLQRGNVHAQQIEVIGITDSATVTSKWLGDKTGRFLVTGLTNMYLQRQGGDSHKDWADEIGSTGFYEFDSVYLYPGIYELYINGVLKPEYGAVKYQTSDVQNDTSYVHTTGTNEYSWVTNMYHQGQVQFYNFAPASLTAPTISSHLTTKQYVDDQVSAVDTNYMHTTGATENSWVTNTYWYGQNQFYNYVPAVVGVYPSLGSHVATLQWVTDSALILGRGGTVLGNTIFTGTLGVTGAFTTTGQATFNTICPIASLKPTLSSHLTRKDYVDSSVSSITVAPYQEASNHVKVITNGTAQYGKVYTSIAAAVDFFSTPGGTNPCWVELVGVGLTISLSHNDLVNYVNVYSDNKSLGVVLGVTGATPTQTMTFKGVTIYMGAYDITTARTYNSFTFEDCTIYAYKDLTLTNCTLKNTVIFQPTGYSVTYDGSTTIDDCKFTQYASEGGSWSGWNTTFTDGFKTNYTMPSDPTAP